MDGQLVESACASGSACDSSGRCVDTRKQQGAACTSAAECLSNFCADGVCCNEACNGACETCETTGLCRMPADDPDSCPVIACSELDAQCVATSMDIATNRCASKGVCKTTTACGFNDGLSCQASADGEGVCAQGSCPPRTVLCGATECEVSSRSQCCVPTNGDPPRCITDDGVTPAADTCADGFTAGCDQQSDCSAGESCGSSGVGEALVCAASGPLTLCESPAISASGSVEGCSTCDGPNPANGWTFCAE